MRLARNTHDSVRVRYALNMTLHLNSLLRWILRVSLLFAMHHRTKSAQKINERTIRPVNHLFQCISLSPACRTPPRRRLDTSLLDSLVRFALPSLPCSRYTSPCSWLWILNPVSKQREVKQLVEEEMNISLQAAEKLQPKVETHELTYTADSSPMNRPSLILIAPIISSSYIILSRWTDRSLTLTHSPTLRQPIQFVRWVKEIDSSDISSKLACYQTRFLVYYCLAVCIICWGMLQSGASCKPPNHACTI